MIIAQTITKDNIKIKIFTCLYRKKLPPEITGQEFACKYYFFSGIFSLASASMMESATAMTSSRVSVRSG